MLRAAVSCRKLLLREQELEATHNDRQHDERRQDPGIAPHSLGVGQLAKEVSPGWKRLGYAQPDQSQAGFAQNESGDGNPELSKDHGFEIGRDMDQYQAQPAATARTRMLQEIRISQR